MPTIISASNLRYGEDGLIHMQAEFAELKSMGEMPFAAGPDDVEPHGRDIYARAIAGEWGPIKSFVPDIPRERQAAIADVIMAIQSVTSTYVSVLPPLKVEEAEDIKNDPNPKGEDYPILDADVGYEAPTLKDVGAIVREEHRETHRRAARLERIRVRAIEKIKKANDLPSIRAITDELVNELLPLWADHQIVWEDPLVKPETWPPPSDGTSPWPLAKPETSS